jgi:regulator of protease activity HflC (stomatin/prohibitin superfamily)
VEWLIAIIGLTAIALAFQAGGWAWALLTFLMYLFVFIYGLRRNWRGAFAWWFVLSLVGVFVTAGLFASSITTGWQSFLLGAAVGLFTYLAAATIMFVTCTEIYIVWRGGDRRRAWRMAFGFIFRAISPGGLLDPIGRMFRGVQIVTGGKVSFSSPPSQDARILGPVMLVVHVGNAVLLDNTGKLTRIVGPGFYLTDNYETIYAIVDLRPQEATLRVEKVLTKDSIPLRIQFTIQYQITSDQSALLGMGVYRINHDAIRRAVLGTANGDWRAHTETVARSIVCDTIASRYLDEIYDPQGLTPGTPRVPLQYLLRRKLSQESQGWGVEIIRVTLDDISMPEEVSQRMIQAWDVQWRDIVELAKALTDARTIVARAKGSSTAAQIEAWSQAQARLQAAGIDSQARLIEAVAGEPVALVQQEIARIEAGGQSRARLEAARIEAEIHQIGTVAAALADLRAAEVQGETERVQLVGKAQARLQAAGVEMSVRQVEAVAAALAELRASELEAEKVRITEIGKATAERERARIGQETAELEKETTRIRAEGAADALQLEEGAKIEAEAKRFRAVLAALGDCVENKEIMNQMIQELVRVLSTVNDIQAFLRIAGLARQPRALPGGVVGGRDESSARDVIDGSTS